MTERPPMGDMRPKMKEIPLPQDAVKEFVDLIPKPENHYHYRITGEWQQNREVYEVREGDGVISDYTFPEKSDMSKVQFATRKTYTREMNMFGKFEDKPVQYDRKSGTWKKLNIFQRVKQVFSKETNIPAQVVTETVKGKQMSVLHTLEQKRPVGEAVQEAVESTMQDAQVALGLKYKYVDHALFQAKEMNKKLTTALSVSEGKSVALASQLARANAKVAELTTRLQMQQAQGAQQAREADPHYSGPIYNRPNPKDVVEGEVVG